MSDESEHSESEFYYPGKLSNADFNYFSRQLTPKAQNRSQHPSQMKFTTFSEANNYQTGSLENNFSGWTVQKSLE